MGINGGIVPTLSKQNQGGTGQRLGMSQVPHRLALSSSSSPSHPAPTQNTDLSLPPSQAPPSPGAMQLLQGWGQDSFGQLCGSKVSPYLIALELGFCSGSPSPSAQLVCLWHPCLESIVWVLALGLPSPCAAIQTQPQRSCPIETSQPQSHGFRPPGDITVCI